MEKRPAVFLDRDGTLIEDVNYLKNIEDIKIFDATYPALQKLNEKNILTVVVTNQSGVARGYFDEDNVKLINAEMGRILETKGVHLDAYYYCPHHKKGSIEEYVIDCDCRKPGKGMIDKAINDLKNIDIRQSYVIGDKTADVDLAKNAGCKGILVKTGYGRSLVEEKGDAIGADYVAEDINDAVDWIIKDLGLNC